MGEIKFFDYVKGWGFIKREGDKPDVFIHLTGWQNRGVVGRKKVADKMPVIYQLEQRPNRLGPKAAIWKVQPRR
jgi:cold shock CspA family protein